MAQLTWSFPVPVGAIFRPLDGWQYERVPFGGSIEILHRAILVDMVVTITSGAETLQERSPVPAGGTAGLIPSAFDVPTISDEVAAFDLLKILYDNGNAAINGVDGIINYSPG